jgi:hypothetical protein
MEFIKCEIIDWISRRIEDGGEKINIFLTRDSESPRASEV